jgi:hypothetical protein
VGYKGRIRQAWHNLKKLPGQWLAGNTHGKQVLWVAGVQRSGTNMLMEAFDRHPLTRVYHESDAATFDNYSLRPLPEIQRKIKASPARCLVIKALVDADRVPELMRAVPGSKTIWPVRDYRDVVASHLRKWPDFDEHIGRIARDEPEETWRGRNVAEETRERLAALYREDLTMADRKALFWWYRNDFVFANTLDKRDDILFSRYETVVTDPEASCRRLCAFAGLPFDVRMASHIDKSVARPRREVPLDPVVEAACEEMLARLTALASAGQSKP